MTYIVGIAGGSGSGKSTLAYGLQGKYPDLIEVVHFDDYKKKKEFIPIFHEMKNWDHPDAIDFSLLLRDLWLLKSGQEVKIMTKNIKHNPDYDKIGRVSYTMKPKQIIIVEGYMSLLNDEIRDLYDFSLFLDLSSDERLQRRTKFISPEYVEKVLLPMHHKFVESTKEFADVIIDVARYSDKELQYLVMMLLQERKIL